MITIIERASCSIIDIKIFKDHLRIDHSHEDEYLKILIETATELLEKNIGISILKKRYKNEQNDGRTSFQMQPVINVFDDKTYVAGITDKSSETPRDLQYAVLCIAKNMYECSDENIFESSVYLKQIINSYKKISIV